MTDKVQKIKDWISKEQDGLMDAQGNFEYPEHEGAYHILCNLDAYIDSLQEEPVSRNPADIESAMQEVEEKSRAFTEAHQGEDVDTILAQMRGEEPVSEPNKQLAETYLAVFDKKFPTLPTLKGKQLADYKDFLNKCQQIFGLKEWGIRPMQAKLFEKLSLLWAAWGAEHLQGIGVNVDGEQDEESVSEEL